MSLLKEVLPGRNAKENGGRRRRRLFYTWGIFLKLHVHSADMFEHICNQGRHNPSRRPRARVEECGSTMAPAASHPGEPSDPLRYVWTDACRLDSRLQYAVAEKDRAAFLASNSGKKELQADGPCSDLSSVQDLPTLEEQGLQSIKVNRAASRAVDTTLQADDQLRAASRVRDAGEGGEWSWSSWPSLASHSTLALEKHAQAATVNQDISDTSERDGVQEQLDLLGKVHVGFSRLDFPDLRLSVVGGRPFSMDGERIHSAHNPFGKLLASRFGVHNFCKSAEQIITNAKEAPQDNLLDFLAHNGPCGLGSKVEDICGRDWVERGRDDGDPDLQQYLSNSCSETRGD